MKTLDQLRATPFFKLTNDEKKQLIALSQTEAAKKTGREASIAYMAIDVMQEWTK